MAARKSTGLRNVENTALRHNRANTRISRSTTRSTGGVAMVAYSSSVRPVRMRNTSSRLARRTSTDEAPIPSLVMAAAVRSPLSV